MDSAAALELAVHLGMELYPMDVEKQQEYVEAKRKELVEEEG